MTAEKLHDPASGQLRIAGFLSGKGSIMQSLLAHEQFLSTHYGISSFNIALLFSDRKTSNAAELAKTHSKDVYVHDIHQYYADKQQPMVNMRVRKEFDAETAELLEKHCIQAVVCAGYMSIITEPLLDQFLCINIHPADLRKVNSAGRRIYTGLHVIKKALCAGERYVRSTIHIMNVDVDAGPILMYGDGIKIEEDLTSCTQEQLEELTKKYTEKIKKKERNMYLRCVEYIARGYYSKDEEDNIYFNNRFLPEGLLG